MARQRGGFLQEASHQVVAGGSAVLGFMSSAEGAHDFTVCGIDEDFEEHWSQDRVLMDTTHHQPPPRYRAIDQNSLAVSRECLE
ncbi:hypothetical protein WISP_65820 [Willisornis vidua]|uniref:Uncharacterized protein n=1 Tax=Willisornis vidua TaxID=1566151 RepID=A0ABQ9DEV1_9PASS|nr:hypothetical protein WISP_65820 [Willisornis vidua]